MLEQYEGSGVTPERFAGQKGLRLTCEQLVLPEVWPRNTRQTKKAMI